MSHNVNHFDTFSFPKQSLLLLLLQITPQTQYDQYDTIGMGTLHKGVWSLASYNMQVYRLK